MPVDLIVFAAIAVFVLLRLYGVLGQQIGHDDSQKSRKDQPQTRDSSFEAGGNVIELTPEELGKGKEEELPAVEEKDVGLSEELRAGIAEIRKDDKGFRIKHFMDGAKTAFDMVLEAFNKDDKETLRALLSKEIYDSFTDELKKRQLQEDYVETTLVSILEAEPVAIKVEQRKAIITVRFVTEQIQSKRSRDGKKIDDSATPIEQIEDEWVFVRDLRSPNPNWRITDI